MKRQQFPHLVPRYRTDLVTSQVLVPNEHRLQVTSPSAEDLRLWFWTWVKSIQFPKRSGIFSVGFCFLEFHLKGIFLSLKKNCWIYRGIWLQPFTSNGGRFPDGYTRERAVQLFGQPNISFQNMRKVYSSGPNQNSLPNRTKVNQFDRFTSPPNNFHINGFTNSNQLETTPTNQLILSQNLTLDLSWLWSSNIATWETPWRFW